MSKLKVITIMDNKAMEEILNQTDLNITELNHLIYAAATIITEETNGTGEYKPQVQRLKPPPWVRRIQGSINDIRKDLSALTEIKQDSRKVKNIKKARLLKKYNILKEDNLDQLIEEIKQNVSAKTQQLSTRVSPKVKSNVA
jgi:mannitol-specific phosphotransferase system IIBC component